MNALRFLKVSSARLTKMALALGGVAILTFSCASDGGSTSAGGSGGNAGGSAGAAAGAAAGGAAGDAAGGAGGQSAVSCAPSETSVCFKDGQAQGAMTGWGWVALGTLDKLDDPTCDTDKHAITKDDACTTVTNWSTSDGLCISGLIPALPAQPYPSDYDNNWGIQIGVNTSEPPGMILGKEYKSVALTVTGTPSSGLRAELHVKGEPAGQTYCADMTSGKDIPLGAFNQACWDGAKADPTKALSSSNIANIDKVGVQVSSTQSEIKVSNLCLVGIAFK